MSGTKYDNGKPPMELLPSLSLEEVAKVLDFGAKKYSAHNWCEGFAWSRLIGAAYRHLGAFQRGEDLDPETKLTHIAHLACTSLFLLEHYLRGLGVDDRYKGWDNKGNEDRTISRDVSTKQAKLMEPNNFEEREIKTKDANVVYYKCGCIGPTDSSQADLVGCRLHYPNLVDEGN